jgi:Holliday junction resolvase RusA-like endonuclease
VGDVNLTNSKNMLQMASNRVIDAFKQNQELFKKIQWKTVSFTIPTIPEPSHRPRLCGYRVYVPGAAKHQRFFDKNMRPKLNGLFIDTPCKMVIDIYCPTPKSFTQTQKILAEMKMIRPWVNTGDVDNYTKSVMDMIQPNEKRGHVGIMSNDCLVMETIVNKYYSETPRYEVIISYMDNIPDSLKKVMRLDQNN